VKNLYDPDATSEVKARLARLQPGSERHWGTMNPAQMLAHLAEFMAMACGDTRPPRMFIGRVIGPLAKRIYIRGETPPPRNSPTVPGGAIVDERDFETERTRLTQLLDRFASGGPESCTAHPHSFFGRLTAEEWAVLMYKHADHHLRQFGL
jgi:uncharacterized protein DUF1569